MEIDEYRLEFLQELRNEAIVDGNDVEDQFVKAKIQELEEIGELIDPIAFSCEMRGSGNRAIAFDAYGYDEADSSFVLLISDFQNTIEKTTLTNTRIDELYARMRNFIVEAYNGDIRRFCDAADPIIDIAKEQILMNANDLASLTMEEALSALLEVDGKSAGDMILDQVFSRFCIGK